MGRELASGPAPPGRAWPAAGAGAIRADARRFYQLVASDAAQGRTAALFA